MAAILDFRSKRFQPFLIYVTPMLPTESIAFLVQEKKQKIDFQAWRPSWISDRNDFSYFWSTSHPDASYPVSSPLAQGCRRSSLKQLLSRTTGIDWSQQLTLSTSCSGELKIEYTIILSKSDRRNQPYLFKWRVTIGSWSTYTSFLVSPD